VEQSSERPPPAFGGRERPPKTVSRWHPLEFFVFFVIFVVQKAVRDPRWVQV